MDEPLTVLRQRKLDNDATGKVCKLRSKDGDMSKAGSGNESEGNTVRLLLTAPPSSTETVIGTVRNKT